jgi:hypothetical protein
MAKQSYTREELESIGGRYWEGGQHRRVYFNDLDELYGLECEYYNSGNISSARLHGESISNSKARKIAGRLSAGMYYDLNTGEFASRGLNEDDMDILAEAIAALLAPPVDESTAESGDIATRIAAWDHADVYELMEMLAQADAGGVEIDYANLPTEPGPEGLDWGYPVRAIDRQGRALVGDLDFAHHGYVDGVFYANKMSGNVASVDDLMNDGNGGARHGQQ